MKSKLVKNQKKIFTSNDVRIEGRKVDVVAMVRYDDQCGNGHNTFSITGETYRPNRPHIRQNILEAGCIHDTIIEVFPELKQLIKWHLTSSDAPMHYVANTRYHASEIKEYHHFVYLEKTDCFDRCLLGLYDDGEKLEAVKSKFQEFDIEIKTELKSSAHEPDLEAARNSAIWPDATLEQLRDKEQLEKRLPALMAGFKADVESLGFTY